MGILYTLQVKRLQTHQKVCVALKLESLAVAWAVKKFHHFLYDKMFLLKTDSIPLELCVYVSRQKQHSGYKVY